MRDGPRNVRSKWLGISRGVCVCVCVCVFVLGGGEKRGKFQI